MGIHAGHWLYDDFGGHVIEDETFDYLHHHMVYAEKAAAGAQTQIHNCKVLGHSGRGFSSDPKVLIWAKTGMKLLVTRCQLPKAHASLTSSIQCDGTSATKAYNNYCFGWGASANGFTGVSVASGNITD